MMCVWAWLEWRERGTRRRRRTGRLHHLVKVGGAVAHLVDRQSARLAVVPTKEPRLAVNLTRPST